MLRKHPLACKRACYMAPIHSCPANFASDGISNGYHGDYACTDKRETCHPPPSPPNSFFFSEWVLIIGPLCCVRILRLHALSQTVSGHQTDGVCMQRAHSHMLTHEHPHTECWHTGRVTGQCQTILFEKKKEKKTKQQKSFESPWSLHGFLIHMN